MIRLSVLNPDGRTVHLDHHSKMANRGATLDPDVFTIADLKEAGSKKMPKMYRGMLQSLLFHVGGSQITAKAAGLCSNELMMAIQSTSTRVQWI